MTATCSSMAFVKHDNYFFMSETSAKDAIYTSAIQIVVEYEIVLSLMAYTVTVITRSKGGALQSLEIDKYISISGIRRCDKKYVSSNRRLFGHNLTGFNRKFRDEFRKDQ